MPASSRLRHAIVGCVTVLLALAGLQVVSVVGPAASASAATATAGGLFVPLTGRLVDSRDGTGLGGPGQLTAGVWYRIQAGGKLGIPTSGVQALQLTLTALNSSAQGVFDASATDSHSTTSLIYDDGVSGMTSNTTITAVRTDGSFDIWVMSATDVVIDLQGYYTSGATAAGGYVASLSPTRIADTTTTGTALPQGAISSGSTISIPVAGSAGVPAGAAAVFVNFEIQSTTGTAGWLAPYLSDGVTLGGTSLTYPGAANTFTALGAVVPLEAAGAPNPGAIKFQNWAASIQLKVDIEGYFLPGTAPATATAGAGSFTPAAKRLASLDPIGPNGSETIYIAGHGGIPPVGSGISAADLSVQVVDNGSSGGSLEVDPGSGPNTNYPSVDYGASAATRSNMMTTAIGSGWVKFTNHSNDSIQLIVDIEGWYTAPAAVVARGQSSTTNSVTLQAAVGAAVAAGRPWVTYYYGIGTWGQANPVPVGDLTDSNGSHPASWPIATSGTGLSATVAPYTWNVGSSVAAAGSSVPAMVRVFACFGTSSTDSSASVCSPPFNIVYSTAGFTANQATASMGPGSLSLGTGDYELSAADAAVATSLGGLAIGRTLTTKAPSALASGASSVFGPGWTADFSGPGAGRADLTPADMSSNGYLLFTDPSGSPIVFADVTSSGTTTETYEPIGDDAQSGAIVTIPNFSLSGNSTIVWTDPDGTITTWTKTAGAWVPAVQQASTTTGATPSTTTTYHQGSGATAGLIDHIIAPTPAGLGVTCTDANANTTSGCRSLVLHYGTPAGASSPRLVSVDFVIGAAAPEITTVAAYDYDSNGRLLDSYDPRISPTLKTAYTYATSGSGSAAATRLQSLTPPGLNTWSFNYDSSGRLSTVSHHVPVTDPSNPTAPPNDEVATSTVVYNVPNNASELTAPAGPVLTGDTAPIPDMRSTTAAAWNETTDLPVDGTATAIFPPDHVPPASTALGIGNNGAEWDHATIHYLDSNNREVNVGVNGAGSSSGSGQWLISTTQYDANGNDYWDLSAGNRAQALNPTADTDPYVAGQSSTATRADLLASKAVFNVFDPTEVTDTYGPTRPVKLASGTTIDGRSHMTTSFDQSAPHNDVDPNSGLAYRLPTSRVANELNAQTGQDTNYPDSTTTVLGYAVVGSMTGDGGWALRQPTTSTVQMAASPSSADLTTTIVYDSVGRNIETRLPGDSTGTTPRTTKTTYITATGTGTCVSVTLAGMVCNTTPGGQPTGSPLPTTTYVYDDFGRVTHKTEAYSVDGQVVNNTPARYTDMTYDAAGRMLSSLVSTQNGPSGSAAVPRVNYAYDPNTGLPTTQSTGTGAGLSTLSTAYNSVGQAISYTDATGNVSSTGYDIDGRPISQSDGKGTTTLTYDGSGEHRGLVTSEDIGAPTGTPSTFSANYNPAGQLSSEAYPNGLVASTTYDNAGNTTTTTYAKSGTTWLAFTATNGHGDRTVATSSTLAATAYSNQTYTYDAAGRLTTVHDTAPGAGANGCVTRVYGFDTHSNRTSLASYPAASGGGCTQSTTPAINTYTPDGADRVTNDTAGSYTYDTFGRASSVPGADASGIGSHAPISGAMSVNYYDNDMVAHQAQGAGTTATTIDYSLDPTQNRILTETESDGVGTSSAQTVVTTNHYSDSHDSPAWTGVATTPNGGPTTNTWIRAVPGIDGNLSATIDQAGNVILQLTNLHGDICATAADSTTATALSGYWETTEYGLPRNAAGAPTTYGWRGGKKRSANALGGVILMGVRLYNTATGRFLSPDPITGGNANAYTFPLDPLDQSDDTGKLTVKEKKKKILGVTVATTYTAVFSPHETKTIADLSIGTAITYIGTLIGTVKGIPPQAVAASAAALFLIGAGATIQANYAVDHGECLRYKFITTPLKNVSPFGQGGFLYTGSCKP